MLRINRYTLFVFATLLAIVFSACAPAVTVTPVPGASVSPANTTTSSTATPEKPKEPTSITIVIPEDPPSFNAIVSQTGYDTLVLNLVMLGLTGVDPDGKIYPELAAELPTQQDGEVKVDEAAGKMDVTWKLRPDVVWSDGVPVTADDVIFTWNAIVDPQTGYYVRGRDAVDSVEKVDDHTVIFHYNSIYPSYLTQLGGEQIAIWPAHYCDPKQGFVSWDCAQKPLSTGPYVLDDWSVGQQMTFSRNPKYFDANKLSIDKIIVKIIPDDAVRKQMMLNNDADIFMWVSETIAEDLQKSDNVKVSVSPTNRWVLRLFPNEAARGQTDPVAHPHPIFSDVNVRQAMQMAIDVDAVAKTAFRGYSTPTWTELSRDPYACSVPKPEFSPEKAAALLESAGWKDTNGDGVRECHGCKSAPEGTVMKAELATYSDYGEPMILAQQLIAEMLKKVGFDLHLVVLEGNVMWADPSSGGTEQNGNFDLDLWDDGYSGSDPTDFISSYYSTASATPGNGNNFVRYLNPQVDELLNQAYTLDEAKRKQVFCQLADIFNQDLPIIPLTTIINADAYNTRLGTIVSNGNNVVTWNVADWTITK